METSTTVDLDRQCIWHPFTQMQTAHDAIPIVRGEGLYLIAEDGRRYMDGISSWWVNLHGHAHPAIAARIAKQATELEQVIFAGFTHAPAVELAQRLLELLPGNMSKIFYSDNGSTAVEVAIKMALQYRYNQKLPSKKILCFNHSYHGDTFGAMSVASRSHFNRPFWSHLFETVCIDPSYEPTQLDDIGCFIFEPLVLGSGGMRIYEASALDALLKRCHEQGVITIADEVMTGFGRTGSLFACDRLQEKPDLICLSKGITGGFLPLGATACKQFIYDAFLDERMEKAFLHGHSYTGNPISCSAALASLDLLLASDAQRKMIEEKHAQFCREWGSTFKRCQSLGTILAMEYDKPIRDRLYAHFLSKNILLRPLDNVLYVMPPYCITESELDTIYENIIETLEWT